MVSYQLTSAVIAIAIAGTIIFMVRRDRLHGPYAIWWLCTAVVILLLGIFPNAFDTIGRFLGIYYPPTLALALGLGLMLIKMLTMDLERSRQERKIRRLTQRIALLEKRTPPQARDIKREDDSC